MSEGDAADEKLSVVLSQGSDLPHCQVGPLVVAVCEWCQELEEGSDL